MAEHMLILKLTSPEGEVKHITGAFPSACGKTNLAMLIPTLARLEGRDRRRRHRVDEVRRRRPPLRDQPRGGLLRRRARHGRGDQPQRHGDDRARTPIFTNCALTDDGDVWWEGMTDEPPAHAIDWHGEDWTPDAETARRSPQRPLHGPGGAVPVDRARVGGPGRRADRRLPVRRAARDRRPARDARPSTGSTASSSARRWRPRRPPRPPAPSASCASTRSPCSRSAATTWPTTSAHWLAVGRARRRRQAPADLLGQLVPQGRGRALPVAGLRRELAASWRGCSAAARARARPRDADRARPRPRAGSTSRASTSTPRPCAELLHVEPEEWKAELPQVHEHFAKFGDDLPQALRDQLSEARAAPRRRAEPGRNRMATRVRRPQHA